MTTLFELLSGKEEELLSFFKEKYNLVENEAKEVEQAIETSVATPPSIPEPAPQPAPVAFDRTQDPHNIPNAFTKRPSTETNKVTKGIGNLFGGTIWGNK